MTYPGLAKPKSACGIEVRVDGAGGACVSAGANPHNLKAFLDAFKAIFKAIPVPGARAEGQNPPSLTHREEFA
jgi:hypothetical protein